MAINIVKDLMSFPPPPPQKKRNYCWLQRLELDDWLQNINAASFLYKMIQTLVANIE